MQSEKSPRILITRLSHIGDCILTLPMLTAIRRKLPNAYIGWAVETPSQQLLQLHPDLDQLILVPKRWLKRPLTWPKLFRELRTPKFDIVIDPQGITKSATLGWISGARTRIGGQGRWGRELSPYLNNKLIETKSSHLVDRTLELLTAIGVENPTAEFNLPACEVGQQVIESFLKSENLSEPFVVINPGASWDSKRWVTERFAEVASHLYRQHGIRSVITWAGVSEQQMAESIHQSAPRATVIAEATSLAELAALCGEAMFFLGCDTGPLHIATAMGTPCLGLYGTTRPEESGAYGPQHVAVQKWYQSGTCRQRRSAENVAMQAIEVSDVNAAVEQMLIRIQADRSSQRRAS